MDNTRRMKIIGISFIAVVVIVFGGIAATRNIGKSEKQVTREEASNKLEKMVKKISPRNGNVYKSSIEFDEESNVADELPDIDTCEVMVHANTELFAEIYSSPEKAGTGTDGWICDLAEEFNSKGFEINGKKISVQIRNVSSGAGKDYISSGKAVPDGFTPSSEFWIKMLNADGIETETISESMVKNTAGIVLSNSAYKKIIDKYGTVDMKSITEATASGEITMGYTNPFSSTTGLNFLACTLERYDSNNPLSDEAVAGFTSFQNNVPFVALTTVQMRTAADKGALDGFVMEYQLYLKDSTLKSNYKFTPFGYRHDNPLVAISSTSEDKIEVLKKFAEFCKTDAAIKLAKEDGFNEMDDYICEYPELDGEMLTSMQSVYKNNKDLGQPVVCVFIADVSGSMSGEPLVALKNSLINSMKYINNDNYIGLVSYSDDVTIETPIAKFNLEQQTLFKGSVEHLNAGGNTATFDAICVGLHMINQKLAEVPEAKTMIFVLSDGETNSGYQLNNVQNVFEGMGVPIYTIGYNANIEALAKISNINEAASLNADTDDIVYQLKQLFNTSL